MVLEYTDYSYRSEYDSVSWGYPAAGGMMTWIDIPNTSNNATDHYITKAGICKIMVSYSKDTNKSCRGSRRDYHYGNTDEGYKPNIRGGCPTRNDIDPTLNSGITRLSIRYISTKMQYVGSRFARTKNKVHPDP